jgi:hypothetical protein
MAEFDSGAPPSPMREMPRAAASPSPERAYASPRPEAIRHAGSPLDCSDHPAVAAVAQCDRCGRSWCGECSKHHKLAKLTCKVCGIAMRAGVRSGDATDEVTDLFRRLFSADCLITACILGAIGVVVSFLSLGIGPGPIMVKLIYLSLIVGYYFNVIHHVGAGSPGMPGPSDATDDLGTMFARARRGIVCIWVGMVPFLIWLFGFHHVDALETEVSRAVLMIVIGQLYMPAVILSVTFGDHTANALWPPAWIEIIARAPGSYAIFSLIWLFTVFVGGTVVAILQATVMVLVPIAGIAIANTIAMLFWFAQAILVGQFIRRNAAAFGWD